MCICFAMVFSMGRSVGRKSGAITVVITNSFNAPAMAWPNDVFDDGAKFGGLAAIDLYKRRLAGESITEPTEQIVNAARAEYESKLLPLVRLNEKLHPTN